jgi:hypothetical protein
MLESRPGFGVTQNLIGEWRHKEPVHGSAKLGETFRIFLDASKVKEEFGWQPLVDLN